MAVEIVDLPTKNGGSFHRYVSLPEGSWWFQHAPTAAIPFWGNHPTKQPKNSTITALLRWPRKKESDQLTQLKVNISLALGYHNWLVVGIPTYRSEKWWNEFVSWDDIPNWMESHSKFHGSKPPSSHGYNLGLTLWYRQLPASRVFFDQLVLCVFQFARVPASTCAGRWVDAPGEFQILKMDEHGYIVDLPILLWWFSRAMWGSKTRGSRGYCHGWNRTH